MPLQEWSCATPEVALQVRALVRVIVASSQVPNRAGFYISSLPLRPLRGGGVYESWRYIVAQPPSKPETLTDGSSNHGCTVDQTPHFHSRFIDFCARAGREAREDRGLPTRAGV